MLALSADCLPIAIARTDGPPALAVLHAGWRGLAGRRRRGGRRPRSAPAETAAIVGPAIGPCCYEVGPEVSARFDADLTEDGKLDLWTAAERALRARRRRARRARRPLHALPSASSSSRTGASGRARGAQGVIGAVAG